MHSRRRRFGDSALSLYSFSHPVRPRHQQPQSVTWCLDQLLSTDTNKTNCYAHLHTSSVKVRPTKTDLPVVVQPKQTDSIHGQDPVSWFQLLTPGCRGVGENCADEDAFYPRGSVLEVTMVHDESADKLQLCNVSFDLNADVQQVLCFWLLSFNCCYYKTRFILKLLLKVYISFVTHLRVHQSKTQSSVTPLQLQTKNLIITVVI